MQPPQRPRRTDKGVSLDYLRGLDVDHLQELIYSLTPGDAQALLEDWRLWAREAQLLPDPLPETWMLMAGRGYGKTRAGGEAIRELVVDHGIKSFLFVATNPRDARDLMIEGPSGVLNIGPRSWRPVYEPSNLRLIWPQFGAEAHIRSSWDPEGIRGVEADVAWLDELAKWKYQDDTLEQIDFALRQGLAFRIITTTPKPQKAIKELVADEHTLLTHGTTFDNIANLSPRFIERIVRRYQGTTIGQQELLAIILEEIEGALWKQTQIDADRIMSYADIPDFERVVIGVDPPGSATGAEAGIIAVGRAGRHGFCLDDRSLHGTPAEWAMAAVNAYRGWEADCIVAERNFGGDMVSHTIRSVAPNVPVKLVHASRGKQQRAEPIATKSERHELHHVGMFPDLENELTSWIPGEKNQPSPNRLDGYVWAHSELFPDEAYDAQEVHVT